jgi:beta-1,4-mannosyl-glycoprotein beta-1,4-N-acetylglucosaminyltransferase
MIYDCFIFYNELELLELRLQELAGVVDKFVLVEATQTHSNKPKPLYYQENRARFSAFHDQIIHVAMDDLPPSPDAFEVERFHRNGIVRGLVNCKPDDWILVSDLDEIPRPSVVTQLAEDVPFNDGLLANLGHGLLSSAFVKFIFYRRGLRRRLRRNHPFIWRFEQSLYRYFLNCKSNHVSFGSRMVRFRDYSCAEEIRHSGYKMVKDAGWHFTYMGGGERIADKLKAFSHQEYNTAEHTDAQRIDERINRGELLFGKNEQITFVPVDKTFPEYVQNHPEKFVGWIKPV